MTSEDAKQALAQNKHEPAHTNGKWNIARSEKRDYVVDEKGNSIAMCGENPVIELEESQANAQRIVKAVNLLSGIEARIAELESIAPKGELQLNAIKLFLKQAENK